MKKLLMSMLLIGSLFAGQGVSPFNLGLADIENGKEDSEAAYAVYGFVDGVLEAHYMSTKNWRGVVMKRKDLSLLLQRTNNAYRAAGLKGYYETFFAIEIIRLAEEKSRIY